LGETFLELVFLLLKVGILFRLWLEGVHVPLSNSTIEFCVLCNDYNAFLMAPGSFSYWVDFFELVQDIMFGEGEVLLLDSLILY